MEGPVLITGACSGCPERWSNEALAHCGTCHRSFLSIDSFDRHRSARGLHGSCLDPVRVAGLQLRTRYSVIAWGQVGEGSIFFTKTPGKLGPKRDRIAGG